MDEVMRKHFDWIKYHCSPYKMDFGDILDLFSGQSTNSIDTNFVGGINDQRNTLHENMFHLLYPGLKKQVHFGTGKGGLEKYHAKRFTADFYDETNKEIYEVDGKNHKTEWREIKDSIRSYFFWHELGIRTFRVTNDGVEQLIVERLEELFKEGSLHV